MKRILAVCLLAAFLGCREDTPQPVPPDDKPVPTNDGADDPKPDQTAADVPCPGPSAESKLLLELPNDICNTPDGMVLLPNGNVLLSIPNFNDLERGSRFVQITPENEVVEVVDLSNHSETGEPMGPLGVCVTSEGDVLFADFQQEGDRQSCVMWMRMEDGKVSAIEPAILGFHVANAVLVRDGYLYVTDTKIDGEATPAISGVFRFSLEEMDKGIIELATPQLEDGQLIAKIECHDKELPLGADGLAFDDQGNLYVGNFADGTVHRIQFDDEGNVTSSEIFAESKCMKSADGLFFDPVEKVLYVADSRGNAVRIVDPADGSVSTLAESGDTDGTDGGMDQPCEVLLRGRELIVSNMDWPVPGCINKQYDPPCTLSVIPL